MLYCRFISAAVVFASCLYSLGEYALGQDSYLAELAWKTNGDGVESTADRSSGALSVQKSKDDFRKLLDPPKSEAQRKKEALSEAGFRKRKRDKELRTDAGIQDQLSGEALNSIYLLLLDHEIDPSLWRNGSVKLPDGAMKEIFFRYGNPQIKPAPMASPQQFSIGAIQPMELGTWPRALAVDEIKTERDAFEADYRASLESLNNMDGSLAERMKALQSSLAAFTEVAKEETAGGSTTRSQSLRYLKDLERLRSSFGYVYAMKIDTSKELPDTVEELVLFMLKYQLQFAPASGSRSADQYGKLYMAFQKQMEKLGLSGSGADQVVDLKDVDLIDGFKNWQFTGNARSEFAFNIEARKVNTFGKNKRENATGTASVTFVVPDNATWLVFDVEGGNRPVACNVKLTVDGTDVLKQTGIREAGDGQPRGTTKHIKWNIIAYRGKSVTFSVVDNREVEKKGEVFCWIAAGNIGLE